MTTAASAAVGAVPTTEEILAVKKTVLVEEATSRPLIPTIMGLAWKNQSTAQP
jgi:hypothetical protein